MKVVITITGKDRPGIIAALTGAIYGLKANLEDATMTILEGEFAMMLLADFKAARAMQKFEECVKILEKKLSLRIILKEIGRKLDRGSKHQQGTDPYVISVYGKDRAGIVYHVSKVLAAHRCNITDLNSKIIGYGPKTLYALLLEVDLPQNKAKLARLTHGLDQIKKKLTVDLAINRLETGAY